MRTYDPAALVALDLRSLTWARNTCRRYLRDVPNEVGAWRPGSYDDREIDAQLTLDAVRHGVVLHYRPHVSAAHLLLSDPERVLSTSGGGWSETYQTPASVAASIRRSGSYIDDLIRGMTGQVPGQRPLVARL